MSFDKALKYMEKRPDKAAAIFKGILKQSEFKEAWINLGTCYRNMDKYALAMQCIDKSLDPRMPYHDGTFSNRYAMALNNKGLIHYTFEEDDLARECYLEALSLEPNNYNTVWNLAELSLRRYCSGEDISLDTCWSLYDYRFKRAGGIVLKNKKTDLISWDGLEKVPSLVVLAEQGFGDMLMFSRYFPLLEQYADKIWIQCDSRIESLFSMYNTCRDPIETDATHGVPLCSLGKIFSSGIPAGDWLKEEKHDRTSTFSRIGVVWSGNRDHVNDRNRSTSPGYFLSIADGRELYTLNPTEHSTKGFIPLRSTTFADTAKNVLGLDLVITVDTALAHLCGVIGMPCWVLMPLHTSDFRWGNSSMGTSNIWYPSVKVIRNPGSWTTVFKTVQEMLNEKR